MSSKSAISLNNVAFHWSTNLPATLNIENWEVDTGQSVFIYGRSGSGKSTLLNIIAGILEPQHGTVNILGQNINQLKQTQRDKFRANHMGVIFQQFNLIPYLSVQENIQLSQLFSASKNTTKDIKLLISQLGLPESLLSRKANQLSVGQQQRVAVARALFHKPEIIIADEPTSALDTETRDEFINLLLQQTQKNKSTILFVSHDKSLSQYFDKTIDLQQLNKVEPSDHVI